MESVAAFAWNGWQASSGISGNLGLEYAMVHSSVGSIQHTRIVSGCMELVMTSREIPLSPSLLSYLEQTTRSLGAQLLVHWT